MSRFRLVLAALFVAAAGAVGLAQLPGPPVGIPQTQQSASHGYNFAYTFIPTGADGSAVDIAPTLRTTTITSATQDALRINPTFILPNSSSSATTFAGLRILTPTLTLNSGSATNLANLKIETAGAGATNNYSLWVVGAARFDNGVSTMTTLNASTGATQALTQAQCGQTFAFDRAAGVNYTLPAPIVGCTFDFIWTVAQTSGTNEVQTNTGSVFLGGSPIVSGTTTMAFQCVPTTTLSIKTNDTTTGGLLGGHIRFLAMTSTIWDLQGVIAGSGTVATPCSNTT